ncbi:MAG: fumarate hydratase, partial [bacterium]|nr:fumarate hydratase [bacterium]MDW8164444.1 fumarate hydratase [Candidatus Omnitrophota bacterium]
MKIIYSDEIIEKVKNTIIEINYKIPCEVKKYIKSAYEKEKEKYSKKYLKIILENIEIAERNKIPICQDTGLPVLFVEIGMDIKIEKGKYRNLDEIINMGIKEGSKNGYLRNSIVSPIERINTKTNTPAVIHYILNEGDKLKITIIAKGFGSENKSLIKMLNPNEGKKGIENFLIETVKKAGSLPCPPLFIGIGIGGSFEKSAILSKYALTKIGDETSEYRDWEIELINKINRLKIGPSGFGGNITVLDLKIETYPTHIAGLPVAINICCWAHRIGSF